VPSIVDFLQTLRRQMDADYFLLEGYNLKEIDLQYHSILFQKEEWKEYQIAKDKSTFIGKITQVEADGKLLLEKEDQSSSGFYMKEIIFK
jgi:hypothetical protein